MSKSKNSKSKIRVIELKYNEIIEAHLNINKIEYYIYQGKIFVVINKSWDEDFTTAQAKNHKINYKIHKLSEKQLKNLIKLSFS